MSYQILDPTGLRDTLARETPPIVIDVRTPEEFDAGHIEGSYNVPILFHGRVGALWNEEFLAVMERHFAKDAALVFV